MATQNRTGKPQGSTTKRSANSAGAKAGKAAKAPERNQARSVAEAAVDLPVGAVLGATDRLAELAEPFTDRAGAGKQLKAYRAQLGRTLRRTERRGAGARRKATREARKTRTRIERETRARRRTVETALKRNRDEVEQRVRRAIEARTSRAQDLVDQVGEQLSALR